MKNAPISSLFPHYTFRQQASIMCNLVEKSASNSVNSHYLPQPDLLEDLLVMLAMPHHGTIGLVGETGTGKSEMVYYLANHLRVPVTTVHVHSAKRPEHIEGSTILTVRDGSTVSEYQEHECVKLYREGGFIFLDEIDKASAEFSSSIHALCDLKPWTLTNGQIIRPHPNTRVIVAANTVGDGLSRRYHTSQTLDGALRNRISWVRFNYPNAQHEISILKLVLPDSPLSLLDGMVQVANANRDLLLGVDRLDQSPNAIGEPFSTRILTKWANYIFAFKDSKTLLQTLQQVFLNNVNPEHRQTIDGIVARILGSSKDKTFSEFCDTKTRRKIMA